MREKESKTVCKEREIRPPGTMSLSVNVPQLPAQLMTHSGPQLEKNRGEESIYLLPLFSLCTLLSLMLAVNPWTDCKCDKITSVEYEDLSSMQSKRALYKA